MRAIGKKPIFINGTMRNFFMPNLIKLIFGRITISLTIRPIGRNLPLIISYNKLRITPRITHTVSKTSLPILIQSNFIINFANVILHVRATPKYLQIIIYLSSLL